VLHLGIPTILGPNPTHLYTKNLLVGLWVAYLVRNWNTGLRASPHCGAYLPAPVKISYSRCAFNSVFYSILQSFFLLSNSETIFIFFLTKTDPDLYEVIFFDDFFYFLQRFKVRGAEPEHSVVAYWFFCYVLSSWCGEISFSVGTR
jgi:hypothetical protein